MGTGKLLGKPNKLRGNDLRWTSILSRGSRNTPSRFMLQKLGISSGSYDPVGSKASFSFFNHYNCFTVMLAYLANGAKHPLCVVLKRKTKRLSAALRHTYSHSSQRIDGGITSERVVKHSLVHS